jgi:hypothetical protein
VNCAGEGVGRFEGWKVKELGIAFILGVMREFGSAAKTKGFEEEK